MCWKWKWVIVGIICCCFFNAPGSHPNHFFFYGPASAFAAVNATTHSLRSLVVALHFGLETMQLGKLQEVSSARVIQQSQINTLNAAVAGFVRASTVQQAHAVPCIAPEITDRIDALSGVTIPLPACPTRSDKEGDLGSDVKVSTSGSVNFSMVNDDFTLVLNDFEILTTRIADGSMLKEVLNLTMTGTVEQMTLCSEKEIASSVTAEIDGDFLKKIDENADGVWEQDIQGDFENFMLDVTVGHFEPNSCIPTNFVVSASGTFGFMDHMKTSDNFTVDIGQTAPAVFRWETVGDSVKVLVDSRFSLTSSCLTGELTLSTKEALIFPSLEADGKLADCPISGLMAITGDEAITITFTSSGGIEIDNNGDGHVDERLENCYDAQFCL